VWCLLLTTALAAAELPPHPRLLVDASEIARLRTRASQPAWAVPWDALKSAADAAVAGPGPELPPRGGNWSHNYVCPEHGARLKVGARRGPWQWDHTCPVGPHTLRGDPAKASLDFDGNQIAAAHGALATQAVECGLVWQVTNDARYAARAAAILQAYAARYRAYPLHTNQGKLGAGARVHSQPLTEASWLIPMAQAADLVWATLSADERRALEQGLFRPALDDVLLRSFRGIHNITCRLASAIGLTGLLLGDEQLIARAVDDPQCGFRAQVATGVRDDGMWFEGASGYHFFALDGLIPLAEAGRHCRLDLWHPRLKTMFDGPLRLATPTFVLPDFNDSGTVDLAGRADAYELAFARYGEPAYVRLAASGKRRGRLALLYGRDELPTAAATAGLGARNSPASGYAVLERGSGEGATWLCLKYGPHGGGHGHYDKGTFVLWSGGRCLVPDSGTHAYGSSLHRDWDKTTLAHNTLTVDETSQQEATGRCLAFGAADGYDQAMLDAGPIATGVSFTRAALLLSERLVLFVDRARGAREHTFDLACHLAGAWTDLPPGQPWRAPDKPGYRVLATPTSRTTSEAVDLRVSVPERAPVRLALAGGEPTEVITATRPGASTAARVPLVLLRRKARQTTWVWALALDGEAVKLTMSTQDGALTVTVEHGGRRWRAVTS